MVFIVYMLTSPRLSSVLVFRSDVNNATPGVPFVHPITTSALPVIDYTTRIFINSANASSIRLLLLLTSKEQEKNMINVPLAHSNLD